MEKRCVTHPFLPMREVQRQKNAGETADFMVCGVCNTAPRFHGCRGCPWRCVQACALDGLPPKTGGRAWKPVQQKKRLPAGAACCGVGWHIVRVPWRAVRGDPRVHRFTGEPPSMARRYLVAWALHPRMAWIYSWVAKSCRCCGMASTAPTVLVVVKYSCQPVALMPATSASASARLAHCQTA